MKTNVLMNNSDGAASPGPTEVPRPDLDPNILPPKDPQPTEPGTMPDVIPGKEPLTTPTPSPQEIPPLPQR